MSEPARKSLVVVTGVGGFVGTNLVPYLEARGFRVVRLSLREPDWKIPEDTVAIVHLAGLAHDLRGDRSPEEYFTVNSALTQAVFDASLSLGVAKFVLVSSVKAVCDAPGGRIVDESWEPNPTTPYGRSKREAERVVLSKAGDRAGVYILRPCMIHGPGNKGNLNALYRWIASGIPYPLGAFENSRSFLSVENLSFVIAEILSRNIASGIYHVADSEALSTCDVVEHLGVAQGRKPRIWRLRPCLIRAIARLGTALGFGLGERGLQKLTESYSVSNRKILTALGKDLPVSAREGLTRTFASFSGS